MFAHIYGQELVTEILHLELLNHELPQALLFYGDRFSGRMSTALETARIIHCSMGGVPACRCPSCRTSHTLDYPYTMIFANRDFLSVIDAAAASFGASRNQASRDLVRQSVNLLIKRFDVMWAGKQDSRQKQNMQLITEIQELLGEFSALEDRFVSRQEGALAKIRKLTAKLDETIKSSNLPVHSVRSLQSWLATKPGNTHAVVVMEGVERFNDASKNALLKFLEEPPRNVTIILLSEGKGRIIPTILSRVRTYAFQARGPEDEASVIRDVYFGDPDEYDSLKTFFLTQGGVDCRSLRDDAQFLMESLLDPGEYDHDRFSALLKKLDEQGLLQQILLEFVEVIRESREARQFDLDTERRCWEVLSEGSRELAGRNQRESLILESCYYRLAGIFRENRGEA